MITDIKAKLLISNCTIFRQTNDRPNIFLTVKRMQHPLNTFHDLAFLIPNAWNGSDRLPWKFMIFFNSKKEAKDAAIYLRNLVPVELRKRLAWFHAGMSSFFRIEKLDEYKKDEVWGLKMTDAGGFGLDVPDVNLVIQFKVPKDLNTLMQRFGRAGRNYQIEALAILIAEPKWFVEEYLKRKKKKRKRQLKQDENKAAKKMDRKMKTVTSQDLWSLEM
ncbi:hypothetical protein C0992_003267 [Termitomyces sp. T32_za158]|nr:hypothetical protein C0992_003267 [Termitomyces sp. T32_za158]